jgi:hypothetical protein
MRRSMVKKVELYWNNDVVHLKYRRTFNDAIKVIHITIGYIKDVKNNEMFNSLLTGKNRSEKIMEIVWRYKAIKLSSPMGRIFNT